MRAWLVGLGLLLLPGVVYAHKMIAELTITAEFIEVQVKYDGDDHDGGPAEVMLMQLEPNAIVEKKNADKYGKCRFARPAPGKYQVIAEDEFGHRTETEVFTLGEETNPTAVVVQPEQRPVWQSILLGFAVIAVLGVLGLWWSRKNPNSKVV